MTAYWRSIVTMALSRVVSKIFNVETQVTQDIGPIFLHNVGPILVTILDQYWSETLANVGPILVLTNIGPIFDPYRITLDQYCTNIQPICNQYNLPYLTFISPPPLPPLIAFYLLPHAVWKCRYSFTPLYALGAPSRTWTIVERLAIDRVRTTTIG